MSKPTNPWFSKKLKFTNNSTLNPIKEVNETKKM